MDLSHAAQAESSLHQREYFPALRTQGRRGTVSSAPDRSFCSRLGVKSRRELRIFLGRARSSHPSSFIQAYVLSRGFILVRIRGAVLFLEGRETEIGGYKQRRRFCAAHRGSSADITHSGSIRRTSPAAVVNQILSRASRHWQHLTYPLHTCICNTLRFPQ